jgi:hypothetical protein
VVIGDEDGRGDAGRDEVAEVILENELEAEENGMRKHNERSASGSDYKRKKKTYTNPVFSR